MAGPADPSRGGSAYMAQLMHNLGEIVDDPAEETFWLFSLDRVQHDLGMVDGSAPEISLSIGGRDFCIKQSPGLLNSSRSAGTTGAAVWRSTELLATWFDAKDNCLFGSGLLDRESTILELGSGVAGLLPVILAPRVDTYCATDQAYTIKLLRENIDANSQSSTAKCVSNRKGSSKLPRKDASTGNLRVAALDWETDDLKYFLSSQGLQHGVDLVIASDCVYNYHLVQPLVQTCVDTCRGRREYQRPSLCLIAQQLRQPDVFEEWLSAFSQHFVVWRLKTEVLGSSLAPQAGYVVHVGMLRSSVKQ
ncbi:hypothetical protein K461DRAFT_279539 [Myriangium duriaei CBS 260.36]|uniref:Diaminohydroxyphosphoribosylamino-pyrimidine deaminase n=1 Tax=Myriangium duriaei CBS 260.36 TaxID=1168546 RepID=A0A9P4MJF6_9PEZI|nr:hypothetical protein K461DRAFT_279539 [Myriangium duriaei CBS 260.36]